MAGDLNKRVRERAYEIWESEGRPEGRSHEHWQQARAEFAEAQSEAGKRPAGRKSASGTSASAKPARKAASPTGATSKTGPVSAKPQNKPKARARKD